VGFRMMGIIEGRRWIERERRRKKGLLTAADGIPRVVGGPSTVGNLGPGVSGGRQGEDEGRGGGEGGGEVHFDGVEVKRWTVEIMDGVSMLIAVGDGLAVVCRGEIVVFGSEERTVLYVSLGDSTVFHLFLRDGRGSGLVASVQLVQLSNDQRKCTSMDLCCIHPQRRKRWRGSEVIRRSNHHVLPEGSISLFCGLMCTVVSEPKPII